jgi:DNA-directed RNA polymerase specialized sigma24 family protein
MEFPTTHWSVLAKATLHGETEARAALELLCHRYWNPVNSFIRFYGLTESEAQDLTQEFMLHIIQKSIFTRADRLQGRFRSFLLGALTRFLCDAADRKTALKRGGGVQHLSLDLDAADIGGEEPASVAPAVSNFDREWAVTILETALERLRSECSGSQQQFEIWKNFLPGATDPCSYETAADTLGVSLAALKSEIHRLRRRLRTLVRAEVGRTVSAPHEIDDEVAHLQSVLMDRGSELRAKSGNFSPTAPEE